MALLPAALPRQELSTLGEVGKALHELRRAVGPQLDDRTDCRAMLLYWAPEIFGILVDVFVLARSKQRVYVAAESILGLMPPEVIKWGWNPLNWLPLRRFTC